MKVWNPAIYIMANKRNGTLYTGVTSNLITRVHQHKRGLQHGFTTQYGCTKLVYYELIADMPSAIAREKQIKAGSRKKKLALIENLNPQWLDYTIISFKKRLLASNFWVNSMDPTTFKRLLREPE